MSDARWFGFLASPFLLLHGCASNELPREAPPLATLELDAASAAEPDDEAERRALPAGSFSGIELDPAPASLSDFPADGLRVTRVIENSPAEAAGLAQGDLLLEARVLAAAPVPSGPEAPSAGSEGGAQGGTEGGAAGAENAPAGEAPAAPIPEGPRQLGAPSDWRELELALPPGSRVELTCDRGGVEYRCELALAARVRPAARAATALWREEERVGAVFRTPTEREARAAGLPPGAGAILVGLARESPWRAAGLRHGDLITAIDGRRIAHPQILLDGLRDASDDARLELSVARGGEALSVRAPVTQREREWRRIRIPLLYSYERERGRTEWSFLLGIVRRESTGAASELRVLWLMRFARGDADRLEELSP